MPFPAKPPTDDERRTELLRLMGVKGYPGVYVLGAFAKYVTVYAQQVRALNLIEALAKNGVLTRRSRLAVVGGGIAGLTAAAAAAVRGAGHVSVFEKLGDTMRMQRVSQQRFLHPYIYDWPENAGRGETADLPLMGWKAENASKVITQLDAQWRAIRAEVGDDRLPEPRYDREVQGIEIEDGGSRLKFEDGGTEPFDVVIMAVGFGRDTHPHTDSYWTDARIDGLEVESGELGELGEVGSGQSWLVSGYGDGALTDLMRLCTMNFLHDQVIKSVEEATREQAVVAQLMEAERTLPGEKLAGVYLGAAEKISGALDAVFKRRRGLGKIWLNCSPADLFSPKGSVLNRLITAYLHVRGRFELVETPGKIVDLKKEDGVYTVTFEGADAPMRVDNVIVRHGPDKALMKSFPKLWEACKDVSAEWQSARQHEDWTREPLYSKEDFDPGAATFLPLRSGRGDTVECVIVTGSRELKGLNHKKNVESALNLLKARTGSEYIAGRRIEIDSVVIKATHALSSPAAYERAVRALCDCEVAIFDITGLERAVMLFLGIRAAVRRGVTVTLTQDNVENAPLPFNLASLNPIPFAEPDAKKIAEAVIAGLHASTQQGVYLDLPAYDAVRQLGEDYKVKPPEEQILILRWFDTQYSQLIRNLLNNILAEEYPKADIVTTLDTRSPQLIEQRLYAAIRRTQLCIADWTGWRPNVFFEIGVRLAVSKNDPLFILCTDLPPGWEETAKSKWIEKNDPSADALEKFFAPIRFNFDDYLDLNARIKGFKEVATGAKLSPGRTYQVVLEAINRSDEPGGRAVHDMLTREAQAMAGPAVQEGGSVPVLFAETLSEQVWRAAIEYLLAAWYYLDGRYNLIASYEQNALPEDDPNLAALRQVGKELRARLRNAPRGGGQNNYSEVNSKFQEAWRKIRPKRVSDDV